MLNGNASHCLSPFKLIFHMLLVLAFAGCQTVVPFYEDYGDYGIQPGHEAFVAARIAVLNCEIWPASSRLSLIPLSDVDKEVQKELCKELDKKIIAGFSGQPHMVGKTPKAIGKFIKKSAEPDHLKEMLQPWFHKGSDCNDCPSVAAFYNKTISNRKEWRTWLGKLSEYTRYSDAVLMPFLIYAAKTKYNDRGLFVAEKTAQVVIFLISTDTGELIWAGTRKAFVRNQAFDIQSSGAALAYPSWEDLYPRLLTDQLWQGFPGRNER